MGEHATFPTNMSQPPVPILDLKRQYQNLMPQVLEALGQVLDSGAFVLGPDVAAFEKEIASWMEAPHAVGVSNGTDALFIALRALGIDKGDQVLSSPFTFFATVSATVNSGATPVFSDIDPQTFNLDPNQVEDLLKKDKKRAIKAIIPVHLYGQASDMQAFKVLSEKFGVFLIEDACQAIGANIEGIKAGNWSSFGCFSLYPTKNLGAIGDAGFMVTSDGKLAEKARAIRNHGSHKRYFHEMIGSNFRMDTLQAAALRIFLRHLDQWIELRQKAASFYDEHLSKVEGIRIPKRAAFSTHTFHQYTIRVLNGKREALQSHLSKNQIAHMIYYPIPCHLQEALKPLDYRTGDFPNAERASLEVLSLPIFPGITEEELGRVVSCIDSFFKS